MPFAVPCPLCRKKFKTSTSLRKHFDVKHQESSLKDVQFFDEFDTPYEQPKAALLSNEEKEEYFKWLGVVVERINGSLIPDHPGKWCHVDCLQVPQQYFNHMLLILGNPILNSVRDVPHRRQPICKRNALRLSYKVFSEQTLKRALEEQHMLQFRPQAVFRNNDEVPDMSEMEAEEALAFARARARKPATRPTSRSVIEISPGEGRCTREVELIWWPSLYSRSCYGKLTLRFFVRKTSL